MLHLGRVLPHGGLPSVQSSGAMFFVARLAESWLLLGSEVASELGGLVAGQARECVPDVHQRRTCLVIGCRVRYPGAWGQGRACAMLKRKWDGVGTGVSPAASCRRHWWVGP